MTSALVIGMTTHKTYHVERWRMESGPLQEIRCLVCGGKYQPYHVPGLFSCGDCGFVSADMNVSEDTLRSLYSTDYFHGEEYFDYLAEEESLRQNIRSRIRTLCRLVPDLKSREVLEIGCAYGFFLDEIRPYVRSVAGLDISPTPVQFAVETLKADARVGNYPEVELNKKFDLIAMWDTIEHLKRPDVFIRKAADDVRDGGILALTTGDIGSLNARLRGAKWRMIHPPTHMHYFSVPTITRLLKRYGFEVIHISHPGNARKLRAILYAITVLRLGNRRLYERLAAWSWLNLSLTLNLFDIMYVIARRDEQIPITRS